MTDTQPADTQPAGTPAADHTPRPHERTATCRICELPIVYSGSGRWLHEADGWDDFDPPHAAAPAGSPEPSTPPAQPSGERRAAAGGHPGTLDGAQVAVEALNREVDAAWRLLAAAFTGAAGSIAAAVDAYDRPTTGAEQYEAVRDHVDQQLQATATYRTGLSAGLNVNKPGRERAGEPDLEPIRLSEGHVEGPATERVSPAILAAMNVPSKLAVGCLLTEDRDMQAFAELPDCPACEGTGKDLPPDWRSKPAERVPDDQRRCSATDDRLGQCELYEGHLDRTDPADRHRTGSLLWADAAQRDAAPPLVSFAGAARDLTGGMGAVEYVRQIRDEDAAEPAPEPAPTDVNPAWAGSCLCEDREAHDPDCRQGHRPDCPADCWHAMGCPRRHQHDAQPAPESDSDIDKLADMITSSPETWRRITDRYPGLAHQIERVIDPDLRAAAAPEPDSGPGWDRPGIDAAADLLPVGLRRQVLALLADRDRLEARDQAAAYHPHSGQQQVRELVGERDAARAALAEAAQSARDSAAYAQQAWIEVDRLRTLLTEAAEYGGRQVLSAQRTCADDLHRALGLPDTGTDWQGHRSWADWWAYLTHDALPKLLVEHRRRATVIDRHAGELEHLRATIGSEAYQAQAEQLRTQVAEAWSPEALATARRDGAADALDWAAEWLGGTDGARIPEVVRTWAAEVRAGTRPVPGSPEPATTRTDTTEET